MCIRDRCKIEIKTDGTIRYQPYCNSYDELCNNQLCQEQDPYDETGNVAFCCWYSHGKRYGYHCCTEPEYCKESPNDHDICTTIWYVELVIRFTLVHHFLLHLLHLFWYIHNKIILYKYIGIPGQHGCGLRSQLDYFLCQSLLFLSVPAFLYALFINIVQVEVCCKVTNTQFHLLNNYILENFILLTLVYLYIF